MDTDAIPTQAVLVRESAQTVSEADFMPVLSVQRAVERKQMMNEFIGKVLIPGVDYGEQPGGPRDKKVLKKSGAEKLCSIFGLSPRIISEQKIEDWTGADHGGEPFFYYKYTIGLYRGDRFMGEAVGSCNSWESKYRYRWVPEDVAKLRADFEKLPKKGGTRTIFEPLFALEKKATEGQYGKPVEYWQTFEDAIQSKTARYVEGKQLGKKKFDGWEMTVDTTLFRIPNPDAADVVNTVQKMAHKRALVAPVLIVTNCSDAFTQDLEDFGGEPESTPASAPVQSEPEPPVDTTPEPLRVMFSAIDKDPKAAKPAYHDMLNRMIAKAGKAGEDVYNEIMASYRERIQDPAQRTADGQVPKMLVKEALTALWQACERLPVAAQETE